MIKTIIVIIIKCNVWPSKNGLNNDLNTPEHFLFYSTYVCL